MDPSPNSLLSSADILSHNLIEFWEICIQNEASVLITAPSTLHHVSIGV